jgi:hypothetical protein
METGEAAWAASPASQIADLFNAYAFPGEAIDSEFLAPGAP